MINIEGAKVRSRPFQVPPMDTVYTITNQIQIKYPPEFDANTLSGGFDI